MVLDAGALAAGLLHLGLALLFGVAAVYIAVRLFDRGTRTIDEIQELRRGNVAVGLVLASVVLAVAIVVRPGVDAAARVAGAALLGRADPGLAAASAVLQLAAAVLVAAVTARLALWAFESVTQGIDDEAEVRRGNVAVAVLVGGALLAVAFVVAPAVAALAASLAL